LRDRRTIDQARAAAPRPATNYEAWIGGLFRYRVPRRRPVITPWMAIVAVVSALGLGVVLIWMVRPSGLLAAVIVGVAMVAFFLVWFMTWAAVTARVHLALLERPELGETRRLAWFYMALLGYPVLSVAVVVIAYGVARSLASG
jgi:hypothetical protein